MVFLFIQYLLIYDESDPGSEKPHFNKVNDYAIYTKKSLNICISFSWSLQSITLSGAPHADRLHPANSTEPLKTVYSVAGTILKKGRSTEYFLRRPVSVNDLPTNSLFKVSTPDYTSVHFPLKVEPH